MCQSIFHCENATAKADYADPIWVNHPPPDKIIYRPLVCGHFARGLLGSVGVLSVFSDIPRAADLQDKKASCDEGLRGRRAAKWTVDPESGRIESVSLNYEGVSFACIVVRWQIK